MEVMTVAMSTLSGSLTVMFVKLYSNSRIIFNARWLTTTFISPKSSILRNVFVFDFVRKAPNKVVSQTIASHNFCPCLYLLFICICVCVSHVVKIATEHNPGEPKTAAYLAGSGFPPPSCSSL